MIRCASLLCALLCVSATAQGDKPEPAEWIQGRHPRNKLNLISWIVDGCFYYNHSVRENPRPCKFGRIAPNETDHPPEYASFDGFYNNVFKTDLGAVDTPLLRRVPPVYSDGTYEPVKGKRINPLTASKELMTRTAACGKDANGKTIACGSKTGKSAFLVFFGQQVVEEMLDAQRAGCPPEYINIPIPEDHEYRMKDPGHTVMPLLRSRYAQSSGSGPGNPRQQLNEITPWMDGGLIYGTAKGWSDVLRTFPNGTLHPEGKLASDEEYGDGYFPSRNTFRLPMANPPPPSYHSSWVERSETAKVDRFFVLGNPRGNENAFLLSFGVVLFRWHNQFAEYLHETRRTWSGERVFQEARKWATATYNSIVYYDWLTEWLGEALEEYPGYDPALDPQIEQFFQTAAMRFGHTLVTPGAYMRDYTCTKCKRLAFYGLGMPGHQPQPGQSVGKGAVRTCNIYWRPQEPLEMPHPPPECTKDDDPTFHDDRPFADVDRLLMGMASQRAEREDNMIVEDLRGRVFGPLEFSRRDLMAINIQRGRDHGTPDYNTARAAFGLPRIRSVDDYMKLTGTATPKDIVLKMVEIHHDNSSGETEVSAWNNIDVWTGGILETSDRPGPLFRAIIKDQFTRIRNADRFWFENTKWEEPRFSKEQIDRIKTLKVFDMIVSVTRMTELDIQRNPFRVPDNETNSLKCLSISDEPDLWQEDECKQTMYDKDGDKIENSTVTATCYFLLQLDSEQNPVEPCTTPGTYDYFSGSELSFILTHSLLGVFVALLVGACLPLVVWRSKKGAAVKRSTIRRTIRSPSQILTDARRQAQLEQFFRIVFQMTTTTIERRNPLPSQNSKKTEKALEKAEAVSLTREEFAAALGMDTSSELLTTLFDEADKDKDGMVSFLDFFTMLSIFKRGTIEDKLAYIFNMHDTDGDRMLTRTEFEAMLHSVLGLLAEDEDPKVVFARVAPTVETELGQKTHVSLADFQRMFTRNRATFGNLSELENGSGSSLEVEPGRRNKRVSYIRTTRQSVWHVLEPSGRQEKEDETPFQVTTQSTSSSAASDQHRRHWLLVWFELHRLKIFWLFIFNCVTVAIFAERSYYYSTENEHRGFRHIAGMGVSVTRGAASVQMWCYAILLVTMCRNIITRLRESFLPRYVPFESFVAFHKYVAFVALLFTVLHVIGHSVNFYNICTQTADDLACIFRDYFRPTHALPKFHYWAFKTVTGLSGILLVLHAAVIFTFATPIARRHAYRLFWLTHQSYPLWYALMLLHGSGQLVQAPLFLNFLIGPLVLFVFDKLVTFSRQFTELVVLEADLLPSGVTRLKFVRPTGFEFRSGQWVRIACSALNSSEFHPFTLTSGPDDHFLTLHIRAVGPFTHNLRRTYEHSLPSIFLDGPYGEAHQDWHRFEVSVLVGGGIGVTPFASILKELASTSSRPRECKKVYFIWVTRSQRQFEWLVDIIKEAEEQRIITAHIFITAAKTQFDLRTLLLHVFEREFQFKNRSLLTGLKSSTHFGRPDFNGFFREVKKTHPKVLKFGVFACGPPPMAKSVEEACQQINLETSREHEAEFRCHSETF